MNGKGTEEIAPGERLGSRANMVDIDVTRRVVSSFARVHSCLFAVAIIAWSLSRFKQQMVDVGALHSPSEVEGGWKDSRQMIRHSLGMEPMYSHDSLDIYIIHIESTPYLMEIRQDERILLLGFLGLRLDISTVLVAKQSQQSRNEVKPVKRVTRTTHISPSDTGESHASFNLVQFFTLLNDIMHILQDSSCDGSRVSSVGVESLDHFFDCDGCVACSPSVEVGRSTDQGVAGVRG